MSHKEVELIRMFRGIDPKAKDRIFNALEYEYKTSAHAFIEKFRRLDENGKSAVVSVLDHFYKVEVGRSLNLVNKEPPSENREREEVKV